VSVAGASGSFFTTDLTLTNRGSSDATADLTYTAAFGGGTGHATLAVPAGRQLRFDDAIGKLRELGVPIAADGGHVGSLRIRFEGLSAPDAGSAIARTTTPSGAGRAGVAVAALPRSSLSTDTALIPGLTESAEDRTNLALANGGGENDGDLTLRVTVASTDPDHPGSSAQDVHLAPGEFAQLDRALHSAAPGASTGFARVDRVAGRAPWAAYAVINDQRTSDGSIVPPALTFPQSSVSIGPMYQETYAVSSTGYTTELALTNPFGERWTTTVTVVSSALSNGSATFDVTIEAGQHVTYSDVIAQVRDSLIVPEGATVVARLRFFPGVLFFARTRHRTADGSYGVSPAVSRLSINPYCAVVPGTEHWLTGLRQDASARTNLALFADLYAATRHVEVYDGDTGRLAGSLDVSLGPGEWRQLDSVLAGFGVRNGYARVTDPSGYGADLGLYAVLNDGAAPGLGTGDGTFLAADPLP
jgi:hypothetical protein